MSENKSKKELKKELGSLQEEILELENKLIQKYEYQNKISKELIQFEDSDNNKLDYQTNKRKLRHLIDKANTQSSDERDRKDDLRYQTLIDCIPDSVYVLDKDLRFVIINHAYLKELGMKKELLIGNKINEIFPVVESLKFFKIYKKVLNTRKSEAVLEEIMFRGEKRWFEVYVYPYPDGILCISSDVTDRKKANEKIKESKEKYELLFNNMINGFSYQKILLDENGKPVDWVFLEVNKAFEKLTGYKRDRVLGRKASEVVDGLKSMEIDWVGLYSRVALEGKSVRFEKYIETVKSWFSLYVYSPKKYYFAVIFQDITNHREYEHNLEKFNQELSRTNEELEILSEELKQTNEEYEQSNEELYQTNEELKNKKYELEIAYKNIEKSENKFRTLFEQSPIAITYFDNEGKIVEINPKAVSLFGINDLDKLKKEYNLFKSVSLSKGVLEEIKKNKHYTFETVFKFNDQQIKEVRKNYGFNIEQDLYAKIFISPVKDNKDNLTGYLSMTLDITELKMIYFKLDDINKKLVQTNEDLRQFANIASHDLIEPIRMISSFSEIIKDDYYDTFTDDGKSYIDIIQDGIDRLNNVVMDLLEYTRTDRTDIERNDCNFNKVLENTLTSLKTQIDTTNAEIIYNENDLPVIRADCKQLEQLLLNLINNAIKFVKDKPPVIKINVSNKAEEWIFSIKDNGIGIKKDYHNKIFNIFQRLHNREEFPGTGIGLAIVKKVIDKHNGRIWLDSKEGEGTTFYFSIPKE